MTTDSQPWQRIRAIVEGAMSLSGAERSRWLADACQGDTALRREVDELLAHDPSAESLAWPAPSGWIQALVDELDVEDARSFEDANGTAGILGTHEIGRRVGVYQLVREIGSGGMGKVYLAQRDDDQYEQRVAIKLIKRGMDTDDILRRFKNERQILANLEHPNIARLLDGGATADGLPYLVLEYVDGIPIDRWCDEHRATIRERIERFLAVCEAVHHAHQNLVVHRDLKPSNILVTPRGDPKLLDFGIAKLLDPLEGKPADLYTLTSERRLTPAYASPEQLRGEPITTASDVFSLGVVLYELLSGAKPFDSQTRSAESAAFERPEKPSTIVATSTQRAGISGARRVDVLALRRMLAGDLDTIVLKAMHADPARRYLSVEQLGADLRRHLDGLPVQARRDSLGYRASKFVRRNKLLVAAVSTIFVALLAGFTTSTMLYFRAVDARAALEEKSLLAEDRLHDAELAQAAERVQRELAEQRFADVRKLATTFIFDVHEAITPLQGSLRARQLIVKTATEYLERLASEKRDDANLQLELAQAWLRIGSIQDAHGAASLGQTTAAVQSYQRAFALVQDLVRADPGNSTKCMVLVDAHIRLTEALISLHRLDEARSACEQTVAYVGQLYAQHPDSLPYEHQLFRAHMRLAEVLDKLGNYADALDHHRTAAAMGEKLAKDWIGDDGMQATLGNALEQLGEGLERCLELDESLKVEQRALGIFQRLVARYPANAGWRREIGACRNLMARNYGSQGCIAEACAESRSGIETMISLSHDDEMNASIMADMGIMLTQYAGLQNSAGEHEDAIRYCRWALDYLDLLVQRNPDNLDVRHHLAVAYGFLATALTHAGRELDGLRVYQDACRELEALAAAEPSDASVRRDLAYCHAKTGESHAHLADARGATPSERIDHLRSAHSLLRRGIDGLRPLMFHGGVTGAESARIEEFEGELRQCSATLVQLGAGAPDDSALRQEREGK